MKLSKLILIFLILMTIFSCFNSKNSASSKDPFDALGIPDLNPQQLLRELDEEGEKSKKKETSNLKTKVQLRTIDDLPNFLQKSNLNEDEGIEILTRFLIQDDITLKKMGVVYDISGFDGIPSDEARALVGTEERLIQRARSAANIHFKEKYPKLAYDAYGAEGQYDEIIPNWRIYKVLMIGNKGENTFVKVCLPLDESETAMVSEKDEPCSDKAKFVMKEKEKNEDYIKKIKSNNFFKKPKKNPMVKLLPGEQLKFKGENNEKYSLSSHDLQQQQYNYGFPKMPMGVSINPNLMENNNAINGLIGNYGRMNIGNQESFINQNNPNKIDNIYQYAFKQSQQAQYQPQQQNMGNYYWNMMNQQKVQNNPMPENTINNGIQMNNLGNIPNQNYNHTEQMMQQHQSQIQNGNGKNFNYFIIK